MRHIAIMPPGMFLSQAPSTRRRPSSGFAWRFSMASAITSRDTSEYFIPSVPMLMPSVTVITPYICGMPPAALMASTGTISQRLDAGVARVQRAVTVGGDTDDGLSKSPSPKPTAREHGTVGERATPR